MYDILRLASPAAAYGYIITLYIIVSQCITVRHRYLFYFYQDDDESVVCCFVRMGGRGIRPVTWDQASWYFELSKTWLPCSRHPKQAS